MNTRQNIRKKWDTPTSLPLSLQHNSDSDYYSDSFESYSSEDSSLLKEVLEKLEKLPGEKVSLLLDYVKSL